MSSSRATIVYDAVCDVVGTLDPAPRLVEGLTPITGRERLVCVVPVSLYRRDGGSDGQEHILSLLLAVGSVLAAAAGGRLFDQVCDDADRLWTALDTAAALQPGGSAGVQRLIRKGVDFIYEGTGTGGRPCGALLRIDVHWRQ